MEVEVESRARVSRSELLSFCISENEMAANALAPISTGPDDEEMDSTPLSRSTRLSSAGRRANLTLFSMIAPGVTSKLT